MTGVNAYTGVYTLIFNENHYGSAVFGVLLSGTSASS